MMTGEECENSTSVTKRKERNFKEEESDSVSKKLNTGLRDSISLLPEDLLGNILSRLPTKLAASTSVLSKRWRNLFALVHNLNFDDSVFVKPVKSDDTLECFKSFVDRTLSLQCGSSLKKFSLKFQNYDEEVRELDSVSRWIINVVERRVLEMKIWTHEDYLPSELFRSKTLVKLTLRRGVIIENLPPDLHLPALKVLIIDSILFENQGCFHVLLAGCPVLEKLSICILEYKGSPYSICSQTIKKLKLYIDDESSSSSMPDDAMSFDAPNLVSLEYAADITKTRYTKVNLKSLFKANLSLDYPDVFGPPDLTNLIMGISNIQTLHLLHNSAYAISKCCEHGLVLPVFNNLVNLSLWSDNEKAWKLLPDLLKQSPKLETLTIRSFNGYTEDVILRPFQVKVLRVLCFGNTITEMADLSTFVLGTESLELVKVKIKKGVVEEHEKISQSLRTILEMAAPNCNIKLEISYSMYTII